MGLDSLHSHPSSARSSQFLQKGHKSIHVAVVGSRIQASFRSRDQKAQNAAGDTKAPSLQCRYSVTHAKEGLQSVPSRAWGRHSTPNNVLINALFQQKGCCNKVHIKLKRIMGIACSIEELLGLVLQYEALPGSPEDTALMDMVAGLQKHRPTTYALLEDRGFLAPKIALWTAAKANKCTNFTSLRNSHWHQWPQESKNSTSFV